MRRLVLICALAAGAAEANDGFGGLTATGLEFRHTEAVAMVSEDLRISPERIEVDYVLRNLTDTAVTGEVIFPLPPIPVGDLKMAMWNLPEDPDRPNLLDFAATVDGRPVPLSIDRVAVLAPPWTEERPLSAEYETPGHDVTNLLKALGIPLTLDPEAATAALLALSPGARAEAVAQGLATFDPATEDMAEEAWPHWSIVIRYHWTQTFPAGAEVRISHAYENRPAGGLFYWSHPPEDWLVEGYAGYCIDEGTSRAIMKLLPQAEGTEQVFGQAWNIAYVLRTANTWAGPIGSFRLTIDKGAQNRVVSLCAEGLERAGPTRFVMEKRDFVPQGDLEILVVAPLEE
jgi:Domain of unknown function (DUF4424)